jgi:hypothetical protein
VFLDVLEVFDLARRAAVQVGLRVISAGEVLPTVRRPCAPGD